MILSYSFTYLQLSFIYLLLLPAFVPFAFDRFSHSILIIMWTLSCYISELALESGWSCDRVNRYMAGYCYAPRFTCVTCCKRCKGTTQFFIRYFRQTQNITSQTQKRIQTLLNPLKCAMLRPQESICWCISEWTGTGVPPWFLARVWHIPIKCV